MFRPFNSARTAGSRRVTTSVAMALALATGAAVGVAGFAQPAYAQKQSKPKYSKGFVAAFEPVSKAVTDLGESTDYSAIKPQLPGMIAAVENEDDRYAAGQMLLAVGNKSKDPALQRQGLELMLASGKVAPEQVGQFQFFVGNLAYQAKDYAAARAALQSALASGYSDDQIHALIIESHFHDDTASEGLAYITKLANDRVAAGQAVPEGWIVRGLQVAYQGKMAAPANDLAQLLVETNPSPDNWLAALQVVREINSFGSEEILDLSRLMMLTGAMQHDYDLGEYVEAADPRKLSNEVLAALDAASAAGVIPANSSKFAEFRQIAEERAAPDRADAAKAQGQTLPSGPAALGTADLQLSVGNYADAEAMYQQAIDKGGIDVNRALTRRGIAELRQGKLDEAKATFAQVQGARVPLAKMWTIYAENKAGEAPAAGG